MCACVCVCVRVCVCVFLVRWTGLVVAAADVWPAVICIVVVTLPGGAQLVQPLNVDTVNFTLTG